jgi:hypothetical protein
MQFTFDTIEEVLDFVTKLKKPRTGKGGADEGETGTAGAAGGHTAPNPIMPPQGQTFNPGAAQGGGFPGAGQTGNGGGFPNAQPQGAPLVAPAAAALIERIKAKYDAGAAMSTESAAQALAWLRGQCGNTPDLANMTPDQIWQFKVPTLGMPQLENMAKLMGG